MSKSRSLRTLGWGGALVLFATSSMAQWQGRYLEELTPLLGPAPPSFDVEFVLDDGQAEGTFGVTDGGTAKQFLFFNQFDLTNLGQVQLEEIWVFFPASPEISPGAPVDLVILHDDDSDPTNGATLIATISETVQVADGATFSIYPLISPVAVPPAGDLLVGIVPRFIVSGVTPPTNPAAIDSNTEVGRSWFAVWTGDPPTDISLPSDGFTGPLNTITNGTFAIRAFGNGRPVTEVPTLGTWALLLLAGLIGCSAVVTLRR